MIQFRRFGARNRNVICTSAVEEEAEMFEAFSIVMEFDLTRQGNEWIYQEVDQTISNILVFADWARDIASFASMSHHGEFNRYLHTGIVTERVPNAGLWPGEAGNLGYLFGCRQIGNTLFTCGSGGQLLARDRGGWTQLDTSIVFTRAMREDLDRGRPDRSDPGYLDWVLEVSRRRRELNIMFWDVNGPSESEIYAAGEHGHFFYWNGADLTRLQPGSTEALTSIFVEDPERIWVCGRNGTLLLGNHRDGFRDISHRDDTWIHNGMALFGGDLYVSNGDIGQPLMKLMDDGRVEPVRTGLAPEMGDIAFVQAIDGVLWAVGLRELLRFDGTRWERFVHPMHAP